MINFAGAERESLIGRLLFDLFVEDVCLEQASFSKNPRQTLSAASERRLPQSLTAQAVSIQGAEAREDQDGQRHCAITVTPIFSDDGPATYLILF